MLMRAFVFACAFAATGCVPANYDRVGGLSPVLDPQLVETDSLDQLRILNAFASLVQRSGGSAPTWAEVARAGFLHIDRQCSIYLNQIYRFDRQKTALRSGISAIGQTASAASFATGASALTLTVLSQAFGLAGSLVDISSDSLLYRVPFERIRSVTETLRTSYKAAFEAEKSSVNSAVSALSHIQSYLELCLPPRIEAEILDFLATGQGASTRLGPQGGPIQLRLRARELPSDYKAVLIRDPLAPQQPAPPPKASVGETYLNDYERKLPVSRIQAIQDALCTTDRGGRLGASGSLTRRQIGDYVLGRTGSTKDYKGEVTEDLDRYLSNEIAAKPSCAGSTFRSPYEVGRFGGTAEQSRARILEIQQVLGVQQTGILDRATRTEIRRFSGGKSEIVTPEIGSRLLEPYRAPSPKLPTEKPPAEGDAAPTPKTAPGKSPTGSAPLSELPTVWSL